MPGNAFLKFVNGGNKLVQGESRQKGHVATEGWIDITDWNWDIEADTSFTKGTGSSVGKAKPNNFSFTHALDASSAAMMTNIVQGTHFDSMEIHMLKQTGKDTPEVYWTLIAKNVFVTKLSSKGGEDGGMTQDVELVFKSVSIDYRAQTNQGKLGDPINFQWDIAAMTVGGRS